MKFIRWIVVVLPALTLSAQTPASSPANASSAAFAMIHPLPDDPACNADDRRFMARAYELARNAVAHGNEPFGALLVKDGAIIFENENSIYTTRDATQHAETGLVSKATPKFDAATLGACTLYTSTEPCIMCCGAIRWAGIPRMVYGTSGSQLVAVLNSLLPAAPVLPGTPVPLYSREALARFAPSIAVKGPLMEAEGLAIHESFWTHSALVKAHVAR